MIRATRTMRARRSGGTCPACRRTMVRGQSISRAAGRWGHTECLAANLRTSRRAA
jgi:transposase